MGITKGCLRLVKPRVVITKGRCRKVSPRRSRGASQPEFCRCRRALWGFVADGGPSPEINAQEGLAWKPKYNKHCQVMFSSFQHHWHKKDSEGHRQPLPYCRLKRNKTKSKKECKCRMGFPKKSASTHERATSYGLQRHWQHSARKRSRNQSSIWSCN